MVRYRANEDDGRQGQLVPRHWRTFRRPTGITAAHVLNGKTAGTITFANTLDDVSGNAKRAIQIAGVAIPKAYSNAQGWDVGLAVLSAAYKPGPGFQFNLEGQGTDRASALNELKKGKSGSNVWLGGYPAQKLSLQPSSIPTSTSGRCTARPVTQPAKTSRRIC